MMNDLQIRDEVSRIQSSIQQYNARKSIYVLVVVTELLIIVLSVLIVSLDKKLFTNVCNIYLITHYLSYW